MQENEFKEVAPHESWPRLCTTPERFRTIPCAVVYAILKRTTMQTRTFFLFLFSPFVFDFFSTLTRIVGISLETQRSALQFAGEIPLIEMALSEQFLPVPFSDTHRRSKNKRKGKNAGSPSTVTTRSSAPKVGAKCSTVRLYCGKHIPAVSPRKPFYKPPSGEESGLRHPQN